MEHNSEIEIIFYAKVSNPEGLKEASNIEDHHQLEARLMDETKIRVRKTTAVSSSNATSFIFTAKKKKESTQVNDYDEFNSVVDQRFFDTFFQVMEKEIKKRRYYFKHKSITITLGDVPDPIILDDVGYEVDVFTREGRTYDYVKIEVEINPILDYVNKHYPDLKSVNMNVKIDNLPFKPISVIFPPKATDEQKAFIDELWKNNFSTENKVV